MRKTEKASDYNTIRPDMIVYYIKNNADILKAYSEGGYIERMSPTKLKKIAAALNNIIYLIEE